MNMGLVTSFIIGGILLLSILFLNINISNSGAELTLTQVTRDRLETVTNMLDDDIPNMGYHLEQPTDTILTIADSDYIQFFRNLCRNPARDAATMNCAEPELITWRFFKDQKPAKSLNSNHGTLIRVVKAAGVAPDTTWIKAGVTNFKVRYYNSHGKPLDQFMSVPLPLSELTNVKQLYIELEVQSNERVPGRSDNERYIRTVWEKRFSPRNLDVEL